MRYRGRRGKTWECKNKRRNTRIQNKAIQMEKREDGMNGRQEEVKENNTKL